MAVSRVKEGNHGNVDGSTACVPGIRDGNVQVRVFVGILVPCFLQLRIVGLILSRSEI